MKKIFHPPRRKQLPSPAPAQLQLPLPSPSTTGTIQHYHQPANQTTSQRANQPTNQPTIQSPNQPTTKSNPSSTKKQKEKRNTPFHMEEKPTKPLFNVLARSQKERKGKKSTQKAANGYLEKNISCCGETDFCCKSTVPTLRYLSTLPRSIRSTRYLIKLLS